MTVHLTRMNTKNQRKNVSVHMVIYLELMSDCNIEFCNDIMCFMNTVKIRNVPFSNMFTFGTSEDLLV